MNKALVVDDSRAIRRILGRILLRNGFSICEAANGVEALRSLGGEAADITLLCVDYNMPEMNGVELLKAMRGIPQFHDLPVMMITTETHVETMQRAFAAGVSEYVMKPFTEDMVVDKLRLLGILPY